ncbi:MAG: hypothetical protein WEB30_08340 [Cyclobacteriaceae bacterium]
MNRSYDYVTVDSPNIALIAEQENGAPPFGQFIPYKPAGMASILGEVKSQDMYLPNFTVRSFEGRMPRNAVFLDQHGQGLDMVGSCIFLKGQVKTFLPGGREVDIVSYNRSQNFKFDPNNEFRHLCLAETDLNFIHISFKPSFFKQLLPENEPWAEKLKTKIERKEV